MLPTVCPSHSALCDHTRTYCGFVLYDQVAYLRQIYKRYSVKEVVNGTSALIAQMDSTKSPFRIKHKLQIS